jgi:outer membrane protein TolC
MRQRPEILEADATIAANKKGIALARRSQLPTLGVNVSGLYNPNASGFAPRTTTAQAVISLSLPIFDGGVTRARVQEARADVATAETNRRQAVDLVALEVRTAYLLLVQSRDRVAVANQALAQAQEAFRLARVRYNAGISAQAGISPLLEVSDAQAALTQAENNRVNALYDYNNSRARLDKAAGRSSFVNRGPGYPTPPVIRK